MADFNPIRDLRSPEADPFNVPAGQSTKEIEDIRLRLVLTREKTKNIVKIVKNKGLTFKKDVEKIQELQRRLRRTIPRIPILRGEASVLKPAAEETLKRRGFGLDLFNYSRFLSKTTTKTPFPLLDVIFTTILITLSRGKSKTKVNVDPKAINKIKEFIRVKPKVLSGSKASNLIKPNVIKPSVTKPIKTTKGKVIEGDASTKTVDIDYEVITDEPILSRLSKIFQTRKLKKFSKEKGFIQFSKKADKIKAKTFVDYRFSSYDTGLEVNRYVTQLQRATTGKTRFKFNNKIDQLYKDNKADLMSMLNQRKIKLEQITPGTTQYRDLQKSIKTVEGGLRRVENSYQRYLNKLDNQRKTQTFFNKERDVRMINKSFQKQIIQGEFIRSLPRNIRKEYIKRLEQGEDLLDKILGSGTPGAFLDTKPMNNDIAMLNTDTSATHFVIIKTDQA